MDLPRRQVVSLALAVAVLTIVAVSLYPLLALALGASPPAWSHWWCSPATLRSASRAVGGSGLGATLRISLRVLEIHWPHLLPIPPALATLVYLRRANRQYLAASAGAGRERVGESVSLARS